MKRLIDWLFRMFQVCGCGHYYHKGKCPVCGCAEFKRLDVTFGRSER